MRIMKNAMLVVFAVAAVSLADDTKHFAGVQKANPRARPGTWRPVRQSAHGGNLAGRSVDDHRVPELRLPSVAAIYLELDFGGVRDGDRQPDGSPLARMRRRGFHHHV